MVGLILVAHGEIAKAFLGATEKICGSTQAVRAVSFTDPVDEKELFTRILEARKELDQGDGVLILTDMFGGTPSNICFPLLKEANIEVLTGMNLPMVIKIMTLRGEKDLKGIVQIVLDCGRENIYSARELLDKAPDN